MVLEFVPGAAAVDPCVDPSTGEVVC